MISSIFLLIERVTEYMCHIHDLSSGLYHLTRVTRRVSHVDQELLTLQENLSSLPVLEGFVLLDI
jgi:hypothetical protein